MIQPLDFEQRITELESKLTELQHLSDSGDINITEEVSRLKQKVEKLLKQTYSNLTPWQKVQVARHLNRPHFQDYVENLFSDFTPLAGDRYFGEDHAIVAGLARLDGQSVMVIGQEKGKDTAGRVKHNFGMPRPEGYRKAQRLMDLADRFGVPILTFIDSAGAHPGVDAEERGQSEAIARSIEVTLNVSVPVVSLITGEGMSGGAIAIGAGNEVLMLEHAIYAVISPEGCASILWRTADKKEEAAACQKLTAEDLMSLKIIDKIVEEPLGGAHRNYPEIMASVKTALKDSLNRLCAMKPDQVREHRRDKFLKMGRNL